jgi:hypothetical protein
MIKFLFFYVLLSVNVYAGIFDSVAIENKEPLIFKKFLFANSMKTIIMTNLNSIKELNNKICANKNCKFLFIAPNHIKIYIRDKEEEKVASYLIEGE